MHNLLMTYIPEFILLFWQNNVAKQKPFKYNTIQKIIQITIQKNVN